MILTVWRMTYAYLMLGSGASACTWEFVNLKDTMQSAEHLEREQAGATGWGQEREGGYAPWSVCFLWNLCGKVPFLRLEVTVRKASWGLGVAQLLCSLPLMEDKSEYRYCLPFLLHLKAVRCEGGRFFLRSKESSLSATLVNELASRQPWI